MSSVPKRRRTCTPSASPTTATMVSATMTVAAIPMVFAPQIMLGWLVKSEPVVKTGHWPMVLAGLAQPGFAIAIAMGSALKGAGETVWPMVSTLTGMFLMRMPLLIMSMWLFRRWGHADWGLLAVWVGILVDLYWRGIINTGVFLRGRWQHKQV